MPSPLEKQDFYGKVGSQPIYVRIKGKDHTCFAVCMLSHLPDHLVFLRVFEKKVDGYYAREISDRTFHWPKEWTDHDVEEITMGEYLDEYRKRLIYCVVMTELMQEGHSYQVRRKKIEVQRGMLVPDDTPEHIEQMHEICDVILMCALDKHGFYQ